MATKIFSDFEATPLHKALVKEALEDLLKDKLDCLCESRKSGTDIQVRKFLNESADISDLLEAM